MGFNSAFKGLNIDTTTRYAEVGNVWGIQRGRNLRFNVFS